MRIDLHTHTSNWSDGKNSAEEMIRAAIEYGLDGMVISDHNRFLKKEEQEALNARFPNFRVFRGCESSILGNEHVLLLGGSGETPPVNLPARAMSDYVRESGALSVLAHPFWLDFIWKFSFDDFCPECMDVMSLNTDTSARARREVLRVARERGMQLVAGSDAHCVQQVGLFHVQLDTAVRDESGLIRELRAGRFSTAADDKRWQAREEEITREEGLAGKILARGGTIEDFKAQGGMACFFSRVAKGGSYFPDRSLLGVRGADFGIPPAKAKGT